MEQILVIEILNYLYPGWMQLLLFDRGILPVKPVVEPFKNCYNDPTDEELMDHIASSRDLSQEEKL